LIIILNVINLILISEDPGNSYRLWGAAIRLGIVFEIAPDLALRGYFIALTGNLHALIWNASCFCGGQNDDQKWKGV
jgi:hypothetical protein